MNDDSVYNNLAGSARQIDQAIVNVRRTSADVQELVLKFKSGGVPEHFEQICERFERLVGPAQKARQFFPAIGRRRRRRRERRAFLASTHEVMSDLSENLEAMKHGLFFRGFFKDRGFYDLGSLSPAEYQSKRFEKSYLFRFRLFRAQRHGR